MTKLNLTEESNPIAVIIWPRSDSSDIPWSSELAIMPIAIDVEEIGCRSASHTGAQGMACKMYVYIYSGLHCNREGLTASAPTARHTIVAAGTRTPARAWGARPSARVRGARPSARVRGARPPVRARGARPSSRTRGTRPLRWLWGARPSPWPWGHHLPIYIYRVRERWYPGCYPLACS